MEVEQIVEKFWKQKESLAISQKKYRMAHRSKMNAIQRAYYHRKCIDEAYLAEMRLKAKETYKRKKERMSKEKLEKLENI